MITAESFCGYALFKVADHTPCSQVRQKQIELIQAGHRIALSQQFRWT